MSRLSPILRKHAPIKAWARRLGVNRVTLQLIANGDPSVRDGFAAKRLKLLLESLEKGEWKWVVMGDPRLSRNYVWEGEAEFERDRRPSLQVALQSGSSPTLRFGR